MNALPNPATEGRLPAPDTVVILLGLLNAMLITAGVFFQKLNGTRGGAILSPWLLASLLCLAPTFFISNVAFALGGRLSIFAPVGAASYLLTVALGRLVFDEPLSVSHVLGCVLITLGVALVTRS